MKRLLEHRDAWGNPAAIWVLAVAVFAIPLIAYGLTFIRLENNTENWLPAGDPLARTFAWYNQHFGSEDKILVSWQGSRLDDPRMERLAEALRGEIDDYGIRRDGSRYLAAVMTPNEAIAEMTRYDVSREEAVRRLTGLLVGPNNGPAALVATLNEAGVADHSAAVDELRGFASAAGIPEEDLALGGSAVGGSALNAEMRKAAWNPEAPAWMLHKSSPLLLSVIVATLLAFLLLRNARMTVYVLGATLLATFASIAVVPAVGSGMNMVLVVMPTLLMVLTLSATIHIVNYYRHAVTSRTEDPAATAARTAWWPCVLAGVTTSLGLISLVGSPLAPVRDFGLFSAIGCLIALPVALWILPGALQLWPVPVTTIRSQTRGLWNRLGHVLVKTRYPVMIGSVALFIAGLYGLQFFRTETKAIRYFPPEARVVQDYHFLENNLSGIVPVETVIAFGAKARQETTFLDRMEMVRAASEAIRQHPEISGSLSLAEFQPVTERPEPDASFTTKAAYFRRSSTVEKRVHERAGTQSFFAICKQSPDPAGEGAETLALPGDELWRITAHAAIMSDADYSGLSGEIETLVAGAIGESVEANCVVTGAIPLLLRTQQAVVDSLIMSFGTAFLMIAAVMCVLLKSVRAGLVAMLPNLLPVAVVFGGISWYGIAVDIGTMITASVALGIAVDGTLHLSETFKHKVQTLPRHEASIAALTACGPALWQTAMVVGGGLLMLASADLLLVSRFGWLMAALVGAACLADVILLPALLAGPLGYVLERSSRPHRSRRPSWIPAPHAWRNSRRSKHAESIR